MDSKDQSRRWLSLYPKDYSPNLTPEATNALDHLRETVQHHGQNPALFYFEKVISYKERDEMSDALASALINLGVRKGDRISLYLQNIPQFIIGQFTIWKCGGMIVPLNPMYREKELTYYFRDASVKVLGCMELALRGNGPESG